MSFYQPACFITFLQSQKGCFSIFCHHVALTGLIHHMTIRLPSHAAPDPSHTNHNFFQPLCDFHSRTTHSLDCTSNTSLSLSFRPPPLLCMVSAFKSGTAVWLIVTLAMHGLNLQRYTGRMIWPIVAFAFRPSSLRGQSWSRPSDSFPLFAQAKHSHWVQQFS